MYKAIAKTLAVTLLPQTTERTYARAEIRAFQEKGLRLTCKEIDRLSVSTKQTLTFDVLTLVPRLLIGNENFRAIGIGKVDPSVRFHNSSLGAIPIPGLYSVMNVAIAVATGLSIMLTAALLGVSIGTAVAVLGLFPADVQALLGRTLDPVSSGIYAYNHVEAGALKIGKPFFVVMRCPVTVVESLSALLSKKIYGEAELEGFDQSGHLYRDTTSKLGKPRVTKRVSFALPTPDMEPRGFNSAR
jgi:hypothetical protein